MGRGLSPLQKWILTTAAGQPAKYGTDRLYFAEILARWYGWRPTRPYWRSGDLVTPLWQESKQTRADLIATHRQVAMMLRREPDEHKYGEGPPDEVLAVWHFNWGKHFDVWEIGEKAYSVATSTVSRSVNRLEARGLVTVEGRCTWLTLTAAGLSVEEAGPGPVRQPIETADGLSVEDERNGAHRQPIDVPQILEAVV